MNPLQGFLEGGLHDNGYNNETSTMFLGGCKKWEKPWNTEEKRRLKKDYIISVSPRLRGLKQMRINHGDTEKFIDIYGMLIILEFEQIVTGAGMKRYVIMIVFFLLSAGVLLRQIVDPLDNGIIPEN